MNEIPNPETPNKRGLSIICKSQFIGAVTGGLLTIVILILNMYATSVNPEDYGPAMLLGMVSIPSIPLLVLCRVFGLKFLFDNNDAQGGASVLLDCVIIAANTFSYFLIGTCIGWIIGAFKKR